VFETNPDAPTGNEPSAPRLPAATLILVAAAVVLMPLETLSQWFEYDRTAVASGQLWRIVTCQLTHCSWDHLFWDAAALTVIGWVLERDHRRAMLVCVGLAAVLIPLAVHLCLPEIATYRGLSGIDSALFILLAVALLRESRADGDRLWTVACTLLLAAFAAKTAYELVTGSTLFVNAEQSAMLPVPLAHVVGALLGAACGWRGSGEYRETPPDCVRGGGARVVQTIGGFGDGEMAGTVAAQRPSLPAAPRRMARQRTACRMLRR